MVVITLQVLKRGERTDRLLAAVAERLPRERLTPSEGGLLPIRFMEPDASPAECWDVVYGALEAVDPPWEQLVVMGNRPSQP
jgi:hypothetical protein